MKTPIDDSFDLTHDGKLVQCLKMLFRKMQFISIISVFYLTRGCPDIDYDVLLDR